MYALCLVSCSIKTDRTACPGLVCLTARGGDEDLMQVYASGVSSCYEGQMSKDGETAGLSFDIERGAVLLNVMSGLHSCSLEDDKVLIEPGEEMDEIYAYSDSIGVYSDLVEVACTLHKQFAQLYLTIIESETSTYPFYVKVKGNVCGMDRYSLSPVRGAFSRMIHPVREYAFAIDDTLYSSYGENRVREVDGNREEFSLLPVLTAVRQNQDSLELEFYDKDFTKADSAPVDILALGDYIKASGYDWTSEDLQDLYVNVDYSDAGVSVRIRDWEKIEL